MILSLNEHDDAEKYLNEKIIDKNIFNKLRVIARYYLDMNYGIHMTEEKLKEYVSQCGETPSLNYWDSMIEKAIKRANKTPAIQIDYIPIYSSELDKINEMQGTQTRRLAFTLLCLEKYRDLVTGSNSHWICFETREIMKMANIKTSLKNQGLLFRKLMMDGYINLPEKASSMSKQVLLADDDGEEVLRITNMNNLGYQYLKYRGEPYFECECCGLTVKIKNPKSDKPQKYCEQCASIIHAKQKRDYTLRSKNAC